MIQIAEATLVILVAQKAKVKHAQTGLTMMVMAKPTALTLTAVKTKLAGSFL
jgi:hypothetical protein